MIHFKKITEQQKEEQGVDKEVVKMIQTNERLVKELPERRRCMIIYSV